jgi:hypothetical protein
MGWKVDKAFQADPAQRQESSEIIPTLVTGNSISDTIAIKQKENTVVLDTSTLQEIVDYLRSKDILEHASGEERRMKRLIAELTIAIRNDAVTPELLKEWREKVTPFLGGQIVIH